MGQPAFNMFEALSVWGKTLPSWQHFLLGKLVAEDNLPEEALDAVFHEYLIDQHLALSDAVRVTRDMELPRFQRGAPAEVSTLTTMTAVSGVNALVTGETLSFDPQADGHLRTKRSRQVWLRACAEVSMLHAIERHWNSG